MNFQCHGVCGHTLLKRLDPMFFFVYLVDMRLGRKVFDVFDHLYIRTLFAGSASITIIEKLLYYLR